MHPHLVNRTIAKCCCINNSVSLFFCYTVKILIGASAGGLRSSSNSKRKIFKLEKREVWGCTLLAWF
jgi:hypothetical protein